MAIFSNFRKFRLILVPQAKFTVSKESYVEPVRWTSLRHLENIRNLQKFIMDRKGENVSKIHICVMLRLAVPFNHSLPKSLPLHEYIIIAWTLFWESQIGTIQKILYRPVIHGRPGLTQYFSLAHVRPDPVRLSKNSRPAPYSVRQNFLYPRPKSVWGSLI